MERRTFDARVERDGRFWLIEVDGVGMTQALSVEEIEPIARDLVALFLDIPADSFDLTIS